ncbi:MAG: hypothetical protein Q8O46_02655 [bacterium]|nr:hypothetical protein [bacterium]
MRNIIQQARPNFWAALIVAIAMLAMAGCVTSTGGLSAKGIKDIALARECTSEACLTLRMRAIEALEKTGVAAASGEQIMAMMAMILREGGHYRPNIYR